MVISSNFRELANTIVLRKFRGRSPTSSICRGSVVPPLFASFRAVTRVTHVDGRSVRLKTFVVRRFFLKLKGHWSNLFDT